jgi:hypothetical protein
MTRVVGVGLVLVVRTDLLSWSHQLCRVGRTIVACGIALHPSKCQRIRFLCSSWPNHLTRTLVRRLPDLALVKNSVGVECGSVE